jgi:hypothetical protein
MTMRIILAATATALLAGCSGPTQADLADQRALMEARPIGPPENCVSLRNIDYTRVRSDRVIDFYMKSGRVYRNDLGGRCPQLGFEERFSYSTSLDRLCSSDLITILTPAGRGASCGLGEFQPVALAAR